LAEGLRQTLKVLAEIAHQEIEDYSHAQDLSRYSASSFKATWSIDWDSDEQRQIVLNSLVADCRRILFMASEALQSLDKESDEAHRLLSTTDLLSKLPVKLRLKPSRRYCIGPRNIVFSLHLPLDPECTDAEP
jgi:hypothetical protein